MLGTTADLVCEAATGEEPISFTWTDGSGMDVSLGDTDGTISVSFSASEDYGTYTCTATNAFGMDTATVQAGSQTLIADIYMALHNSVSQWLCNSLS